MPLSYTAHRSGEAKIYSSAAIRARRLVGTMRRVSHPSLIDSYRVLDSNGTEVYRGPDIDAGLLELEARLTGPVSPSIGVTG